MAIRYSYDDYTTEGHGVIEGQSYYVHKSKTSKRKNKPKKATKIDKKNELKNTINHLTAIKSRADAERRAQDYAKQHPLKPNKKIDGGA
jgi:uncharacterized Zn finger protein (UPF0148 family)